MRSVIAVAILAIWSAAWSCGDASTSGDVGRDMDPTLPLSATCDEVSLAAAREAAPFELVMPAADAASAETLSAVWVCTTSDYALEFESGVTVWFQFNSLEDPAAEWRGLAREYREFSVGDVNGVPASFADPAVDGAIGGVDWVVGSVRYTVGGIGSVPLDTLIGVAESMDVPKS